jgi:hypothetical protein
LKFGVSEKDTLSLQDVGVGITNDLNTKGDTFHEHLLHERPGFSSLEWGGRNASCRRDWLEERMVAEVTHTTYTPHAALTGQSARRQTSPN